MWAFLWREGSPGARCGAGRPREAAGSAFHGRPVRLLGGLWGASLIMVWPSWGPAPPHPPLSLSLAWRILTQEGTYSALKLIHKVLLCPCQGPGSGGLRGDEMCEVQSWPRAVHRPHSQEKGGLRAQKRGPWGLGNWVREGFPERGDCGRRVDKMWHVAGEGEGSGWGLLAKPWGPHLLSPVPHA